MNKTVKNSMIYFTGTIIMGVLGFVSTIVLTRVLSTQVYAMYGLLTTFVSAVSMFISFGYDEAYMRFYYNHGYSSKYFMSMCMKVPMVIFLFFVLLVIEPTRSFITYIFGEKLSYASIVVLILYVLFAFIHRFLQLTSRMEEFAGNYVISNIVAKSGFIAIIAIVYLLSVNVAFNWVLMSFLLSSIVAVGINLIVFVRTSSDISKADNKVTNKELFNYGFPYMLNNVLILVIPLAEKLIIRDLGGWEILGTYTAAAVFQTMIMLIANTITNIWRPIVFKNCDNETVFRPILHNFGLVATVVVTFCLAGCILLRRWLVLLLDNSYYEIYTIVPTVIYGTCIHIVSLIYSVGIEIKKKTKYLVFIPIGQFIISVVLCYMLIPRMGLAGVAIATFVSMTASKIYKIGLGLKLYATDRVEWKAILLCICGILAAISSLFLTTFLNDVIIVTTLIAVILIVVNKELVDLVRYVLSMLKIRK